MEKDIAYARRSVEGSEFAAWEFFKPSISQPLAMRGNHRFVPTHHRNYSRSSSFITSLLLVSGNIISQLGRTITKNMSTSYEIVFS